MGRKENRLAAALEQNPFGEVKKIQKKYLPSLMDDFSRTKDPRNQSYITYSNKEMLSQMYYKGIAGIESMQGMTQAFNTAVAGANIYGASGEDAKEYLPHHVTENEYLARLDPEELRMILHKIAYEQIRRKTFDAARFNKKWIVIIDGTQGYSGSRKINEACLERHFNKGTDEERINYHNDILEAKIYFGNNLVLSLWSEFIENETGWEKLSEDKRKQDCETKAFKRLAENLKKLFPRLPIVLLMDSLYASEPIMEICEHNGWDYIIRYKTGSIPSISEEYDAIPEKTTAGHAEFVNEIDYKGRKVNMLRFYEIKKENGKEIRTEFQWLTSITITKKNAEKMAATGRLRWKIENQGFNRQKNWNGDITHACSWNINALKNHYLMQQISDFVRQLYEWFYLRTNGIVKTFKKISSDLLYALTKQQLELEDMKTAEDKAFC